jgi:hypothetical protein
MQVIINLIFMFGVLFPALLGGSDAYTVNVKGRPTIRLSPVSLAPSFGISSNSLSHKVLRSTPSDSLGGEDSENQDLRGKLRKLTGFSLSAFRSTWRAATGISLTAVYASALAASCLWIRKVMSTILSITPAWVRCIYVFSQ